METCTEQLRLAFQSAVSRYHMLGSDTGILVGYSGGADSAALLSLLHGMCTERGIYLAAMHVHHGIRGEEADRDAAFCAAECERLGVDFLLRRADIPAMARESGCGLEETARDFRYRAFAEAIVSETRLTAVATAHHADDNAETVLMNLLRGTGIDGLCGIPPVRGPYIRPLLSASASDIRDFCREENIPIAEDSTNLDTAYTRNYIRAEIVPRLSRITPAPQLAAARMCELLRDDAAYLHEQALRSLEEYADTNRAPLALLRSLPDALLSRAVTHIASNAMEDSTSLSAVHIRAVTALIRREGHGEITLPSDYLARTDSEFFFVEKKDSAVLPPPDSAPVPLKMGMNRFPEYGFGIFLGKKEADFPEKKNIYKLFIGNSFPSATIQGELFMRFRLPGDTVRMGGMTRHVKKLLNEKNIPPKDRARLPFICDENGILWIPGVCRRDAETRDNPDIFLIYFIL